MVHIVLQERPTSLLKWTENLDRKPRNYSIAELEAMIGGQGSGSPFIRVSGFRRRMHAFQKILELIIF